MNNDDWGTNLGWNCTRTQARWSNTLYSGSATPTTILSKGNPTWKSNSKDVASGMTHNGTIGVQASGNPLEMKNYYQNPKWGRKIEGTGNKWTDGPYATENGRLYEGEEANVINLRNYTAI